MQKYKNFFDYLFETVELNPVIPKRETMLPFSPKDEKLFRPRNIKEEPLMSKHYQDISGKEMKSEKFRNLSKQRNLLKKQIKQYEIAKRDQKEFLFQPVTMIRNDQEWLEKIEDLKIVESEMDFERSEYQKNLDFLVKRFFSVGGKMPRRYLYLPLSTSNSINLQEIEKLNYTSPIDIFRKIKGGNFLIVDQSHQEIINYLNRHGYRCDERSYIKNQCVNENGKTIAIDMELKRISEIDINGKMAFITKMKSKTKLNANEEKAVKSSEMDIEKRKDYKDYYVYKVIDNKENINLFLNHVIVLTWVPRLIMAQSSNTVWKSCMRYFIGDMTNKDTAEEGDEEDEEVGGNVHFVQTGIRGGTFIAWLIDLDDKKIRMPKARILMKPYQTENKTFYWPSTVYSTGGQKNIIDIFAKTMKLYALSKQKDVLGKKNSSGLQIGKGIYHDTDDIAYKSDLMSQPELIRNILSNYSYSNKSKKIDQLFRVPDYTSRGIEVFMKSRKVKDDLFNNISSDLTFFKLMKGMVIKKEFRLINLLFNIFKEDGGENVFFDKLSYYISKSFQHSNENGLDRNTLVYLYKSIIIPNVKKMGDIDLMSVKYIIDTITDEKAKELYNKTAIDDMIDIAPDFFNNLNKTDFEKIFFLLKNKTLEKILEKNPNYREILFDFYIPELFKTNKDKFYFFINNFKIDFDNDNYGNEEMIAITMIDVFKDNISTISYKDLIELMQSKYFKFSEDVQEQISFNLTQYQYISIISRFNENEIDNILKIGKARGLDIEEDYYEKSKINKETVKLLYEAFQKKGYRIEKEIDRVLKFIKNNPENFKDIDLIQQVRWQIENKREINYDFLNKLAEVLSEINKFNDKKNECTDFVDCLLTIGLRDRSVIEEKNKLKKPLSHFIKSPNFWPYILRKDGVLARRVIEKFLILYLFPEEFKNKKIQFSEIFIFFDNKGKLLYDFDLLNLMEKNKLKVTIDEIEDNTNIFNAKFILNTFKFLYENRMIVNKISTEDLYYNFKILIPAMYGKVQYEKKETASIIQFYKKILKNSLDESKIDVLMSKTIQYLFYGESDYFKNMYFDFFDEEEQVKFIEYFFEKALPGYVDFKIKDIEMIVDLALKNKFLNFTQEKLYALVSESINKKVIKISLIVNLLSTENVRETTKQFLEKQKLNFFNDYESFYNQIKEESLIIMLKALSLQKLTEIINADPIKYQNVNSILARLAKRIIEGIK